MAPKLCILLLTYDRREYAERTLRSTLDNLQYPVPMSVHIADDGTGQEYQEWLMHIAGGYRNVQGVSVSDAQRGGYGMNYNLALQAVHSFADLILPLEDDWQCVRPFDLVPLADALGEEKFGCIRLGYIGYTQPLRGEFISAAGRQWLLLDPDSPEPHVWSGHPRLESQAWQRRAGPWPEDCPDPGTTEFDVAHRREAREGVVWPVDLVPPRGDLFAHMGTIRARHDQQAEVTA